MLQEQKQDNSNILALISNEILRSKFKIEEAEKNIKKKEELEKIIRTANCNLPVYEDARKFLKDNQKEVTNYINDKKEKSLSGVYSGILAARSVIPDAMPVSLNIEGKSAMIITERGDNVNKIEGSAFRASLSYFVRNTVLRNSPYINFVLFDEPFTTLSVDSSANLSIYLSVLSREVSGVLIEQKDQVFSNIEGPVYNFQKNGSKTIVTKV